jgi:hypothetical protein
MDAGLLTRFRDAEPKIVWRAGPKAPKRPRGHRVRVAHLNDEEARVESWSAGPSSVFEVDSGPLGALVLLLEIDRRGLPSGLGARESGQNPAFPSGSIVAAWGKAVVPQDAKPRLADLVELARYALA